MPWQPITITDEQVRAFAAKVVEFSRTLDDFGRAMLWEIIARAGGEVSGYAAAQPGDGFDEALTSIWQERTTIAPLYSGNMPNEGGDPAD